MARGMLIDLLCMMFEAKHQGQLSKADGTARSELEIVDAISGATREVKLAALRELEASGAIKRNRQTGVLYSSRMMDLANMAARNTQNAKSGQAKRQRNASENEKKEQRNPSGSASEKRAKIERHIERNESEYGSDSEKTTYSGGQSVEFQRNVSGIDSETSAGSIANIERNGERNESEVDSEKGGVTDTVSVSVSDSSIYSFLPGESEEANSLQEERRERKRPVFVTPLVANVEVALGDAFRNWIEFQFAKTGTEMPEMQQDYLLMDLTRRGVGKAIEDICFSIRIGAKNILDSSHDLQRGKSSFAKDGKDAKDVKDLKSYGQSVKERLGI
jgi:hypothetical protein